MNRVQETFEQLSGLSEVSVLRDVPLAGFTRFGIGGPADLFVQTANTSSFVLALNLARGSGLQTEVIGGGTNLVVSDDGFRGVVLKLVNEGIEASGSRVTVQAGTVLQNLVDESVRLGMKGLETMTGIPGSTGAAIYGNAGAYGHSIAERVVNVRFFDGHAVRQVNNAECEFRYRESVFKRCKDWIIFSAELAMEAGDPVLLKETADRILETRNRKYPPTMKCAGSIFKNFLLAELPPEVAVAVPPNAIIEGKVPSAWFLEQVGAKGMRLGDIQVATYHANLIYNDGHGTACEVAEVIDELKRRVREQWGIGIEEEVQYVGFPLTR